MSAEAYELVYTIDGRRYYERRETFDAAMWAASVVIGHGGEIPAVRVLTDA